ncbi:MAG TPA: DegT/DnrJ/EryC1/StrS family aminotransferase [Solirubrobacterales bacterium]|nr:DegT/DnrJ/EryC1/StrS family aminotransferase [Solirubrobacterales bacterium]
MTFTVPFVDLGSAREELGGELEAALERVLKSDWFLLGNELEEFERSFAEYCGVEHCVGVGSGLSALELGLKAAGVGPGDEVIVPAYTWIATWTAVSLTGATPVGVDVLAATYNIDPAAAAAAVTERTAAIVPVHLRGEPAAMEPLRALAAERGLFLFEDAAQAHGARADGTRAGALGDAAAFSFYPAKNLGSVGDGGAVTTNDAALAERLRLLRNYGMRNRYEIESTGVNSRLDEIGAASLRVKLPHLDRWNEGRRAIAAHYREALAGEEGIELPVPPAWAEPVWHLFVAGTADRDATIAALGERGVQALVHYPVLPHLAPPYLAEGHRRGEFPVAERLSDRAFSLPMYPQLPDAGRDAVVAALREALRGRPGAG